MKNRSRVLICLVTFMTVYECGACQARKVFIETVAGTGSPEHSGDSGRVSAINIGNPFGVVIGLDGALYITEIQNHRVLQVDLKAGRVLTVAGCGQKGYAGDGGPAVDAELNEPYEVRFDRSGNMYVVEMKNHIIRRVDAGTKKISTVAGDGRAGFRGDGGPATEAQLNQPHSIALDREDAIYVADIGNHRIRRIDPQTGRIDSVAGNDERKMPRNGQSAHNHPILGPRALDIDGNTLWIALREGHSVWRMNLDDGVLHHVAGFGKAGFTGDGGPATHATFNGPKGIAVGPDGDVFVVDSANNAIRRIEVESGRIFTLVGGTKRATSVDGEEIQLEQPHGVCAAKDGAVFIGDTGNHRVLRVHERAD
jgi:DNA-binding beta-propeller fold protein YncE